MNPRQKPSAKALLLMLGTALLFVGLAWWMQIQAEPWKGVFDEAGRFTAWTPKHPPLSELLFFVWVPKLLSSLSLALACGIWLWFSGQGLFGKPGIWLMAFPGIAALLELVCSYLNAQTIPAPPDFSDIFLLKAQWWLLTVLLALGLAGFWISRWLFRNRGQWF